MSIKVGSSVRGGGLRPLGVLVGCLVAGCAAPQGSAVGSAAAAAESAPPPVERQSSERQSAAEAAPAEASTEPSFDGVWDTSFGSLRLNVAGDGTVTGTYASDVRSRLKGRVAGERLEFTYSEVAESGEGWFELTADGDGFDGGWRAEGTERFQPWTGERIHAEPGRTWLVILEARWEESLRESEYTFGEMLRSYFRLAPDIAVRERRFHDEADFRRFASEVAYIAEPVVLLVSTHGSKRGLSVAGKTIGARAISSSLREATNLRLLHLAGCDLMEGNVPAKIMEAFPESRRFPISGYTTSVDWSASALSDFMYLTFLMIYGEPADEAVRQTHINAPYTDHRPLPGSAFDALGLSVLMPD